MDLERRAGLPPGWDKPRNILISGGTGLLGRALTDYLRSLNANVFVLTRSPDEDHERHWDPAHGKIDLTSLPPLDGVVHLAGENVGGGRWTDERKRRILESREKGTELLASALAELDQPPPALVSASGINIYPANQTGSHDEHSDLGTSFLAEVCKAWEAGTRPAEHAGIRVTHLRLGAVLSPRGGALKQMLPPFKFGLGGPVGGGRQRFSWIAIDDAIDIIHRALIDPRYKGPANAVSPHSVTNQELTRALGRSLRRPAILPVPGAMVKALFGEMADETVLADLAVAPGKLTEWGYPFRFPRIDAALDHLLGAKSGTG
ncbi:MAG: TIGR01777 family oxidoreductase [Verrucomicrobiota bacterium]